MSRWAAVAAIVGVLTGGWTAGVLMAVRAVGAGFGGAEGRRLTLIHVTLAAGLLLLAASPAMASWIAARQGWIVAAWILGVLAAFVAVVLIAWLVYNWGA